MTEPLLRGLLDPTRADALVRVADTTLSYAALLTSATAVAEAMSRESLSRIAIDATPTMDTVISVVGAILAGVEVVPIPADAGPGERAHILNDSGADLWPATAPNGGATEGAAERAAEGLSEAPMTNVRHVIIAIGRVPAVALRGDTLIIQVAPQLGYAGRPSSSAIRNVVMGQVQGPEQ